MGTDRVVQLRWEPRTVAVDDVAGYPSTLTYPGIAVVRQCAERVVGEVWLPVGEEEPTFADDEALIAALRTAWSWSQTAA
ncbi:hypothetical protein [Amycolatopsis regifaucium]|uniref:hypothetical protein n=1 Tax=Amycolatopsis regifaucium TaxID=546365 RepID=UPI001FC9242B|nr:hypothetical protein [Amycolatopsis regifaucium]